MLEILKNLDDETKTKYIKMIKPLAITAGCMVVVFISGFGAGKMHSGTTSSVAASKRSLSTNYTTKTDSQTNTASKTNANASIPKTAQSSSANSCTTIKGSKSKIYHIPGGSFYDRTTAAQCFTTEEEAIAAGFTKSSR